MGKNAYTKQTTPNAPELQQIISQSAFNSQPPHNPYYPDLGSSAQLLPPPPYSDLSTSTPMTQPRSSLPMGRVTNSSVTNYPRANYPSSQPTIIVQQPATITTNYPREKYHRKVRKYNSELFIVTLLTIVMSIYAMSLYNQRKCADDYVIHKINDDIIINLKHVKAMFGNVVLGGLFIMCISFIKCCAGQCKTYTCYQFIIGLATLIMTLQTGYLAYLAFYSPCSTKFSEMVGNVAKSVWAHIGSVPRPDQGANVFQFADEDRPGVIIFIISLFNFIAYLSGFFSAIRLA